MTGAPWPWRAHLGAMSALLMIAFMSCTGTPGLDAWKEKTFQSERSRQKLQRQAGALTPAVLLLADLNRALRLPISMRLKPVQRVFRIGQAWHVYGVGPQEVKALEIWVDGTLRHRSRHPDHDWLSPQLEHRRLRPMAQTLATKAEATNWRGLSRWIIAQVQADFPEATEVIILGTRGDFGVPGARPVHGRRAAAPDWALEVLPEEELPDSHGPDGPLSEAP